MGYLSVVPARLRGPAWQAADRPRVLSLYKEVVADAAHRDIPPWMFANTPQGRSNFDMVFGHCAHEIWKIEFDESKKFVDPRLKRENQDALLESLCGNSDTNMRSLWDIYKSLPDGTRIVEEDILGNTQRSILFDVLEGELFEIKGSYYSPEAVPPEEVLLYLRSRIRGLFDQAFHGQKRRLILDTPNPINACS